MSTTDSIHRTTNRTAKKVNIFYMMSDTWYCKTAD